MQSLPAWPARVAAAHTIPRELSASETYPLNANRLRAIRIPTLLVLGGASPAPFREATRAIAETLPNARAVVLPGQGHIAMGSATDLFTTEVLRFLTEDEPEDR
jgi:pimeloyl-ACP methyl ester carboxylesterase